MLKRKKSKFSPAQVPSILNEFDNGKKVEEITREHGISRAAFYKWRERYGGMTASELKRVTVSGLAKKRISKHKTVCHQ